jgi:hypothetical protein
MESVKQVQKNIDSLTDDDNDMRFYNAFNKLERAKKSENFKLNVLPIFIPMVKECIEKAQESYYITIPDGRKYIYYPTKHKLHTIVGNKHTRKIYLHVNGFLKYFSFINEG